MTNISAFTTGFAISGALIIAIGAQNSFVLRQGLRREHVGPIVLFCALADLLFIATGVAGLGLALKHMPMLSAILTVGGASFLFWYGLSALRRAITPSTLTASTAPTNTSLRATLLRTAGFTFLNPHVYIDTMVLVGVIGGALPAVFHPAFVAGAGFASLLWFCTLGFGARLLAPLFATKNAWRALDGIVATTMFTIAARLLLEIIH
ncbi:MAG: amino acid transporter [Acidocella sp. 20-57-95]|nr:MAG: amino acid transporter [Acidocella sp. 20-57-95]HQT63810.1 LysE/ArgO family amino acid transporter [Acidocella sp.]HQU05083.1 LysE/ArgO family amino acid transporter [Acidocella sp.]